MTHIFAVANEKGGVAKTTSVISIGGALVEQGFDVLLVDLDAQANLTLALGIQPSKVRHSTADMLLNSEQALSISRATNIAGLDIIPANSDMNLAERFLSVRQNYTQILRSALAPVKLYDFILLDCPPLLGAVTLNALTAADFLIIPTQTEYFSTYALRSMLQTVKRVQSQENPDLTYKILITMFDVRNRIHRTIREQLYTRFGEQVFREMIQIDTKLRESVVAGVPIGLYAKKSRSAHQYRALVQELTIDVEKIKITQPA
ncbi:MAG: ParA family protein [Anaerolineales bacterium]|jgi:chromosome partitioning protein